MENIQSEAQDEKLKKKKIYYGRDVLCSQKGKKYE